MAKGQKKSTPKQKDDDWAGTIGSLRAKLSLTQERFAAKVGVTWSTVSRWENGRGRPSPLATLRLEEILSGEST